MFPRRFALYGGSLMILLGVLSLIPALSNPPFNLPVLQVDTSYGLFMGIFPMNIFNKVALIIFGALGIAAAYAKNRELPASIYYSRLVFVAMGALAILGAFPQTNTLMGYWPLFGNEILAHGLFALVGAYYGFALTMKVPHQGPWSVDSGPL